MQYLNVINENEYITPQSDLDFTLIGRSSNVLRNSVSGTHASLRESRPTHVSVTSMRRTTSQL